MGLILGATYQVVTTYNESSVYGLGLDTIVIDIPRFETRKTIIKLLFALTHLSSGGILYINAQKSYFPVFVRLCKDLLKCKYELVEDNNIQYIKIVRNYEG